MFKAFLRHARLAKIGAGAVSLPFFLASAHADTNRGVYVWGDNSHGLISRDPLAAQSIRTPTKVDFLGTKEVKSVAVCPEFAVAVLGNGRVVQWTSPTQHETLNISGISKVLISTNSHNAIALGGNGSVYIWKLGSKPTNVPVPKLGWFEKIVDVQCGQDHFAARTNHGKVFTGFLDNEDAVHFGQLGVAAFPHYEPIPKALTMHQVKLIDAPVKEIACGSYHTLLLTDRNEVWGCGSNLNGQLMLPYTYRNIKVSVPTKMVDHANAISAGSSITLFEKEASWFVSGNGEFGQFGTGSFSQCQLSPIECSALKNLREFDEVVNDVVSMRVNQFSVGSTHIFAKMNNRTETWLMWGSNEKGQLGNGKLSKIIKPAPALAYGRLVAGDRISASY